MAWSWRPKCQNKYIRHTAKNIRVRVLKEAPLSYRLNRDIVDWTGLDLRKNWEIFIKIFRNVERKLIKLERYSVTQR